MLPREVRLELNDGKEISLVTGLRRLRSHVLDALSADTIVILDTHWHTTVEHVFSSHERRSGKYTSEELPRGISQLPYDYRGDPELAEAAAAEVTRNGVKGTPISDPYLPVHYGTINLVHYLCRSEKVVSVSMVQTGETEDFLHLGEALGRAVASVDRRVVVLASGGMTHRFWPLRQLVEHEASDPVHIFTPEARAADEERLEWMAAGDHARIISTMPEYLAYDPEAGFGHYLAMVAAVGGDHCRAPGRQFSDYENATGTGQVHVWFDRPSGGWTG
jgi:3,4-dihydroxyphenylacetate 2,3-dioxygenase